MRKMIGLCLLALAAVGCGSVHDAPPAVQASTNDNLVTTTAAPATTTTTAPDPAPYVYAAMLAKAEEQRFYDAVWAQQLNAYFGAISQAQAEAARESARPAIYNAPRSTPKATPVSRQVPTSSGSSSCAIPAYICQRESGGSYTAVNPSSGAGGKYQFMPSTWRALGGTGLPQHAPPHVQDAMAAKLWANGAGCAHWSAC